MATYKAIKEGVVDTYLSDEQNVALKMAFAYQIFFLLYGITGNSLYDPQCYYPYIICCAMGYSAINKIRNNIR